MGHLDSGGVEQGQCGSHTCAPLYPNSLRGLSSLLSCVFRCLRVSQRFVKLSTTKGREGKGEVGEEEEEQQQGWLPLLIIIKGSYPHIPLFPLRTLLLLPFPLARCAIPSSVAPCLSLSARLPDAFHLLLTCPVMRRP